MQENQGCGLEEERVRALMDRDAGEYTRLCCELGIYPEDEELCERGQNPGYDFGELERVVNGEIKELKPRKRRTRKRIANYETYVDFLDEAEKIGEGNVLGMKATLSKYFGHKFGPSGSTPLGDMNNGQIMGTFYGNVKYAKRMAEEKN